MSDSTAAHHALAAFLADSETDGDIDKEHDAAVRVLIWSDRQYVNLRGSAVDIESVTAVSLPTVANTVVSLDARTVWWMGPDEWLLRDSGRGFAAKWSESLAGESASVVDLSDGYVALTVAGTHARDVLAKGCTLDLRPMSFTTGVCAQTAIARTAVLIAATDEGIDIVVRRTFAEYLALWLRNSAAEYGVRFVLEKEQVLNE